MNRPHRKTLELGLQEPVSKTLEWTRIEALRVALRRNGRVFLYNGAVDIGMVSRAITAEEHAAIVEAQRRRLGTTRGFIAVKPNCSIQSYVPAIHPLKEFGPKRIAVCTYQAISGAGKHSYSIVGGASGCRPSIERSSLTPPPRSTCSPGRPRPARPRSR